MKGMLYLGPDSQCGWLQRAVRALDAYGNHAYRSADSNNPVIHWDPNIRVPWVEINSGDADAVLRFIREMPIQFNASRVFAIIHDELRLDLLGFNGKEGIYACARTRAVKARARATSLSGVISGVVRIEVAGPNAADVAHLYCSVRNGSARWLSGWNDIWQPSGLEELRWEEFSEVSISQG